MKFDSIRPFNPDELPAAYEKLLQDPEFHHVIDTVYPGVPHQVIADKMRACPDNLTFQKTFFIELITNLADKMGYGFSMDSDKVDLSKRHTFITNHRDIILDSAILSVLLLRNGCETTTEIAIGDNLLARPWISDIIHIVKAFIVRRSLPPREFLLSSKLLSEYMHYVINTKHDNIWIAQREGRAKDSNDLTQPSILKMMCMAGEGTLKERLLNLHLCPIAISYEYDPCDYLKAKEFQLKRDTDYKKSKEDDLINMKTGIFGWKGHIKYRCAPCIDEWLKSLPDDMPKNEFFDTVAAYIDTQIHLNYEFWPINYIALDMLEGKCDTSRPGWKEAETYFNNQLAKIDLPNPDMPYLREKILAMYANPLRNFLLKNKTNC